MLARTLIAFGLIVTLIGVLLLIAPRAFAWFGHLPGDLRLEREGVQVYIPFTSMILVSVLLSLALNVLLWLLRR